MKKLILISLSIFIAYISDAQLIAQRYNFTPTNPITEYYVTNSPGSTFGTSSVAAVWQDSTLFRFNVDSFAVRSLQSTFNHGTPTSIVFANNDGVLRRSPIASIPLTSGQITTALGFTPANAATSGTVTSVGITSSDLSISSSPVTTSGNITANLNTSGISAGTYISATYNTKGIATAGSNPVTDTLSAARAFNTSYQMSTTKYVDVRPSAQISCNLSLSGGQSGVIFLETSPDNITWTSVGQLTGSNTGTLTVGLNTTQLNGGQLGVMLPPSYYWRMRTSNVTGTPTFTNLVGNKITY